MKSSVFVELKFWLLVATSAVLPFGIYATLLAKRAISRFTVLWFGLGLVALSGMEVYLLQGMASLARATASLSDDSVFTSELSFALYVLPAMFAGIGINMISHVLIRHLVAAEGRFEREHRDD